MITSMLEKRNILCFDPFYFPDGKSVPKKKYFIVLRNSKNQNILASLPTRKDSVPSVYDDQQGCISLHESDHGFDLVCYRIEANKQILENSNFFFDFPTHIYGTNLKLYPIEYFELYPFQDIDYQILGKVKFNIFNEIIDCLKENKSVKRGYRELLKK